MKWHWLERGKGRAGHRLSDTALFSDLGERELRVVEAFAHERQFLPDGEILEISHDTPI